MHSFKILEVFIIGSNNTLVNINVTYNLILGDKLEKINSILNLNKKENREQLKNKLRNDIKKGLEKDRILNKEDKDLINRLIEKLKKELKE